MALVLVTAPGAHAREYTEPAGPGYVQNPDGTWTYYSEKMIGPVGKETPVRLWTYSNEEYEAQRRRIVGTGVDMGSTGQTDTIVPGDTTTDSSVAKKLVESLRGAGDKVPGSVSIGFSKFLEALKTGPNAASVWGAIGVVTMGPTAFKLGVDIGNGIDELLGIPTWGGTPSEPTEGFRVCAVKEPCEVGLKADTIVGGVDTTVKECQNKEGLYAHYVGSGCPSSAVAYAAFGSDLKSGGSPQFYYPAHSSCWQDVPPPVVVTGEGTNSFSCGVTVPVKIGFVEAGELSTVGVPGPGLTGEAAPAGSSTCAVKRECKTSTLPPIGTPTLPSLAGDANGLGGTPKQNRELVKEVAAASPEPPLEGKVLGEAGTELTVPPIDKAKKETGTQYKERLEAEAPWEVTVKTLSEAATDPTVGPEGASYTVPGEGTVVAAGAKKAKIVVEQNPATASEPKESGEGSSGGGPIIPAIKWPSVSTPCTHFPFGVPCWLVERFGELVATAKAPHATLHLDGAEMHVNLSAGESVMEYVRAVEEVFAVIFMVLLFGRFASSSSGSGGSDA